MQCPYLDSGGCRVARILRLCKDDSGYCVVNLERCAGIVTLPNGRKIGLWETCSFYQRFADCRKCRHFEPSRSWCRRKNKRVEYYIGFCSDYDGPRPVL